MTKPHCLKRSCDKLWVFNMTAILLPLLLWNSSITQSKAKLYLLQFRNLDTASGISVECAYKINILQNYCNKLYKQTNVRNLRCSELKFQKSQYVQISKGSVRCTTLTLYLNNTTVLIQLIQYSHVLKTVTKLGFSFLSYSLALKSVKRWLAHLPQIPIFPAEPALLLASAHHWAMYTCTINVPAN